MTEPWAGVGEEREWERRDKAVSYQPSALSPERTLTVGGIREAGPIRAVGGCGN